MRCALVTEITRITSILMRSIREVAFQVWKKIYNVFRSTSVVNKYPFLSRSRQLIKLEYHALDDLLQSNHSTLVLSVMMESRCYLRRRWPSPWRCSPPRCTFPWRRCWAGGGPRRWRTWPPRRWREDPEWRVITHKSDNVVGDWIEVHSVLLIRASDIRLFLLFGQNIATPSIY